MSNLRVSSNQSQSVPSSELDRAAKLDRTVGASKTGKAEKTDKASAASTSSTAAANTEISSKGKEFAKAKAAAAKAPDVREDRVADLKSQIASGKYKVDSDAIADRMFDEHIQSARMGGA
jgi:negative regulator of flagellin synthesis FlgM